MSSRSTDFNNSIPLEAFERIDRICVNFEASWKSGQPDQIKDCLDKVVEAERPQLLFELLLIEFAYLTEEGREILYGDYRTKFCEYASTVESAIDKVTPSIEVTRLDVSSKPNQMVGKRIRYIGNYEILEEIARGGMGVVYKAQQQKLNRIVALKMILSGRFAGDEEIERFLREAQAAGQLSHPNIVAIHEIGEFEGRHYFTMDYVDGQSLADLLREETLSSKDAAKLVRSIAETVHFAHENGTLHRDLKPSNILINKQGVPLVTDFGLAKMDQTISGEDIEQLTGTNQIVGTPSYMSPEQANGKTHLFSAPTDVWAIGAILYACLTGKAPFMADNAMDTMLQVINNEPVSPRLLNPSVPRDLETICLKCLSKEAHQRYGTAQLLADDLARFFQDQPVLARPVNTATKFYRWTIRNPLVASLVTLAILLLVSGTVISSYFAIEAEERAISEKNARLYAETQEKIAESALVETQAALKREAESLKKAEHQKSIAKKAEFQALKDRRSAETSRRLAEAEKIKSQAEKKRAQWQTYVARLQPMRQAWLESEFGHLERLLAETTPTAGEPDFRGWEWYYLQDQVNQASKKIFELEGFTGFFEYDPIHHQVLIAVENDNWELRSLRSNLLIDKFTLNDCVPNSVKFSPNGEFIAWGTTDVRLQVMHLESHKIVCDIDSFPEERKLLAENHNQNSVECVSWSPHGGQIAASSLLGGIKIWDAISGEFLQQLQRGSYDSIGRTRATLYLDWHKESGIAAAIRDGYVSVFAPESGKLKWTKKYGDMYPSVVRWNEAGTRLVHGGRGFVIYDAKGVKLATLPHVGGLARATWINNDELVCGGSNQDVQVYNVIEDRVIKRFHIHQGRVEAFASIDSDTILSGSNDGSLRKIELEDSDSGALKIEAHSPPEVHGVTWHPDGLLIGTAGYGDDSARIWNANTGKLIADLIGDEGHVTDIQWNANCTRLVTLHQANVRFWNPDTYQLVDVRPIDGAGFWNWYRDVQWRKNDTQLVMSSSRVTVFDSDTLKRNQHLTPKSHFLWYSFSPDDKHVAAVSTKDMFVCDATTGETLFQTPKPSATSSGYGVDWSPDGRIIAVGGGGIFLYNASTYQLIKTLSGHRSEVLCIEYSPNGKRIASVGRDSNLIIWDASTGALLLRIPHQGEEGLEHLEWSPDGRRIAVTTKTGNLWIWGSSGMVEINEDIDFIDDEILQSVWTPKEQLANLDYQMLADPENNELILQKSSLAVKMQQWQEALDCVQLLLEKTPGDTWRPAIGLRLAKILKNEDLISQYSRRCLELALAKENKIQIRAHAALSLALVNNKLDYDELVEITAGFESMKKNAWQYDFPHAMVLLRAGRYSELESILNRYEDSTLQIVPTIVLLIKALKEQETGESQKAVMLFQRAQKMMIDDSPQMKSTERDISAVRILYLEASSNIFEG